MRSPSQGSHYPGVVAGTDHGAGPSNKPTAPCPECDGSGERDCPWCYGFGESPASPLDLCPDCMGALTVPCEECHGTGQLSQAAG